MVDGYYRMRTGLPRKKRRRKIPHPKRCQWVEDAFMLRSCPKILKMSDPGPYCKKHMRVWKNLTEE